LKLPGRPVLALLTMSVLWGYGWTAMKIGLLDAPPFKFTAVRMTFSALCLLAMLPLTGRAFWPHRSRELMTLALVQTSALFTFSTLAVAAGSPGHVAFLVYTMPFFTLLIAWPLLGERVRGLQWLAIVLAAAGLIAIIQPWHLHGSMASNVLGISAGIAWAIGAVMVKRLQQRAPMDLLSMTAWQMFFGSLPLLAIAWWVPEAAIVWSPRFVATLILISVGITAFGWMLWMYALNNLTAGAAGLATLAAPPIAMLSSAIQFGERPTALEGAGMCFIILALLVLSLKGLREGAATPAAIGTVKQ